jgi:hypothetical protein
MWPASSLVSWELYRWNNPCIYYDEQFWRFVWLSAERMPLEPLEEGRGSLDAARTPLISGVIFGLSPASIYFLISVGLSLAWRFGLTRIISLDQLLYQLVGALSGLSTRSAP